jgi:endonuclease YncB( thermonuclease family)
MSSVGAAPRAAAPISNARAAASRRNGAKSRGPKTPEGKARAAQNALKHGMRAQKHVLLPQEDAAAFEALEATILAALAPEGALQTMLARRVAVAAWRLERADRLEAEVLEVRSHDGASAGVALIRDGNGTRAFETLLRYRGAAMAEFWRALRTLKALQAEAGEEHAAGADVRALPPRPRVPARLASRPLPNEPERPSEPAPERPLEYVMPAVPAPGHALHEPAAPWTPNEPDAAPQSDADGAIASTRSGDACAPRIPRVAWTA